MTDPDRYVNMPVARQFWSEGGAMGRAALRRHMRRMIATLGDYPMPHRLVYRVVLLTDHEMVWRAFAGRNAIRYGLIEREHRKTGLHG